MAAFARDMRARNWDDLRAAAGPDAKVKLFEEVIKALSDKHFPLVRIRKRSNEWPWITLSIRRLWKRKLRLYKRKGRSQKWLDTNARLQQEIEEVKAKDVDKLLKQGNSGGSFYAATKMLSGPAGGKKWDVCDMFDNKSPENVCNKVLTYFGAISGERSGPPDVIPPCVGGLPEFTIPMVVHILKTSKKTQSQVPGGPLPRLLRDFPESFAEPVAVMFNDINGKVQWPRKWKTEYLTIIPKNQNPSDLAECRNISCTSLLSKILENQVLKQLSE